MLSILIPTYNRECHELVHTLAAQADEAGIDYEIIVADDASTDSSPEANRCIDRLPHCRFIILENNVGRARIRNWLAGQASGDWLLLMDCDAQVSSPDFIRRYVEKASEAPVLCGGLRHPDTLPQPDVTLRYAYEKAADRHRSADERRLHPYECFTTFCFAIRRDTFLSIRFDENCREYGYEDTLFGEELKRKGIPICHFENPLIHMGLESNDIFLKKTETALRTMISLQRRGTHFHSRLANKYGQFRRWGLHLLLPLLFRLTAPLLRKNLLSKNPSLKLFACYKLGYYSLLKREAVSD